METCSFVGTLLVRCNGKLYGSWDVGQFAVQMLETSTELDSPKGENSHYKWFWIEQSKMTLNVVVEVNLT